MRCIMIVSALLVAACGVNAQTNNTTKAQTQIPPPVITYGPEMFKQYCAACHGSGAKGDGPAAYALKIPPANLTTLAKRHGGKFPTEYVAAVLRFGPGITAHGSTDMPTWGPLFQILDKQNERAVQQRIKNLSDYLASLQEQ